jgi:transposase-like protein
MDAALKIPKTLQEAISFFSDPNRTFEYAKRYRWPSGEITCPRCQKGKHSFVKTRKLWFCYVCKKQFTLKVGTIMEDSPISLDKWMTAFWMLSNCKNGISSYELAKAIGIHQESAWFMLQRIREVMKGKPTGKKLGGGPGTECEADETFVGGLSKNMHRSRRLRVQQQDTGAVFVGKTIVQGILDRNMREVRAKVVPNVKRETSQNEVLNNVKYGSTVYTDDAVGYDKLHYRFVHDVVNHAETYVKGRVHTNGLENFWSLLKRTLRGTYVAVEPFHLDHYVDEQVFRFNNRKSNDSERFALAMSQIAGKRLTYAELTGKNQSPRSSATGTGEAPVPF